MGSKETMLEIRLILPEVRGAVCSLETTTMKRRFLAVIVAVVMIATGVGAETRVYQGTLAADTRPQSMFDSEGGTIVGAFPSIDTRIRLGVKKKGGRFSISEIVTNGKRGVASRFRCRRVSWENQYYSRTLSCKATSSATNCFFGGSCKTTDRLTIADDSYEGSRPLILILSLAEYPRFWTVRSWGSAVTRIR